MYLLFEESGHEYLAQGNGTQRIHSSNSIDGREQDNVLRYKRRPTSTIAQNIAFTILSSAVVIQEVQV